MRAIGIELRRSAALWTGVLVLGITLGLFYGFSGPWGKGPQAWTAEWTNLARWMRYHLTLVWPLALAAGAWQGRRDHRAKMDELLTSTPRPALSRVLPPAVALCLGLAGAYLVLFVVGAVQVAGNTSYNHFGWVPILLVGFLALFAGALLGLGIGRVLPFVLTAPVLAVIGLAAMIVTSLGAPGSGSNLDGTVSTQVSLLGPSMENVRDTFTTIATQVTVLQIVWFTALGLTGFALFAVTGLRARLLALIPVTAAAALVLPLLPSSADGVVVQDTDAVALVCADGSPRVCVSRIHEDSLTELVGPAREALAQLAKLPGPQPTSVVESMRPWQYPTPDAPKQPGVLLAQLDSYDFMADPRRTLLAGPSCLEAEHARENAVRRAVVASWFDGELASVAKSRPMPPQVVSDAEEMWQALRALPAGQQAARVAELRAQVEQC